VTSVWQVQSQTGTLLQTADTYGDRRMGVLNVASGSNQAKRIVGVQLTDLRERAYLVECCELQPPPFEGMTLLPFIDIETDLTYCKDRDVAIVQTNSSDGRSDDGI